MATGRLARARDRSAGQYVVKHAWLQSVSPKRYGAGEPSITTPTGPYRRVAVLFARDLYSCVPQVRMPGSSPLSGGESFHSVAAHTWSMVAFTGHATPGCSCSKVRPLVQEKGEPRDAAAAIVFVFSFAFLYDCLAFSCL